MLTSRVVLSCVRCVDSRGSWPVGRRERQFQYTSCPSYHVILFENCLLGLPGSAVRWIACSKLYFGFAAPKLRDTVEATKRRSLLSPSQRHRDDRIISSSHRVPYKDSERAPSQVSGWGKAVLCPENWSALILEHQSSWKQMSFPLFSDGLERLEPNLYPSLATVLEHDYISCSCRESSGPDCLSNLC